jgi:putative membrane protein
MLKKYHNFSMALLTGFMIGSLNKIWPWKNTMEWGVDRHGEKIAILQENVLPQNHIGDPQLINAILLALFGAVLIILLELTAKQKSNS